MSADNEYTNMKSTTDELNVLENNLLFKIQLADGTFHWVQISEDQAQNLGLQFQTENKLEKIPVITSDTQHQDVEEAEKLNEDESTSPYVYKVVKPEDLDLKPVVKTHLPRGRPRKRPNQKTDLNNVPVEEPQKIVKQVRTRSGRITKPPKHIEKDFKKIDISNDEQNECDLKTTEFEPLTTNETPTEEPLQVLQQHTKKRTIPSRFRCPTCNKAYLGKTRIMSHFHKHPDHGPLPKYCKLKHDATWNFLILTSQKYKEGPKGAKFCQELEVLLQNARTLAQYLFKPVTSKEEGYFISETLAHIFGMTSGNYYIDETELSRDVTLYEYLENTETNSNVNTNSKLDGDKKTGRKNVHSKNVQNTFNSFDYMINNNQTDNGPNYRLENSKKDYNNENISNIEKDVLNLNNINLALDPQQTQSDISFSISNGSHDIIMDKQELKSNCTDAFVNTPSSNSTVINSSNSLAVVKYEMGSKDSFIFNRHGYDNINSDIDNVMDTSQLNNFDNLQIKRESVFDIEDHKENVATSQNISEKQNSHITLQNELHDVDELILVNVDGGQVSNMLDNSSNSDDIMNVDQFVNERFKKLTEHDMDIQNNLLNLELPPLDIFQFHTS